MANIMITKRCNLGCPYCFAKEFVKSDSSSDISIERFRHIMNFILLDGSESRLGLIGGEPTLHSRFDELLELLISEDRAKDVILYTNGILTGRYVDKLRDPKFHLLVNCNDIKDRPLLWTNFEKSLDVLFACLGDRVNLGVNYYKIDFNTDFILALVKKYHCPKIRVSISLPNTKDYRYQPLNYFSAIKPELLAFFSKAHDTRNHSLFGL